MSGELIEFDLRSLAVGGSLQFKQSTIIVFNLLNFELVEKS
jgi:hypothetical protein